MGGGVQKPEKVVGFAQNSFYKPNLAKYVRLWFARVLLSAFMVLDQECLQTPKLVFVSKLCFNYWLSLMPEIWGSLLGNYQGPFFWTSWQVTVFRGAVAGFTFFFGKRLVIDFQVGRVLPNCPGGGILGTRDPLFGYSYRVYICRTSKEGPPKRPG